MWPQGAVVAAAADAVARNQKTDKINGQEKAQFSAPFLFG